MRINKTRRRVLYVSLAAATVRSFGATQPPPQPRHRYDNGKAFKYAKDYCSKSENSCGVFLKADNLSDCSHFIAHCLAAGGIEVKNPDKSNALCPKGLAVRSADIENELRALAKKYKNVFEIDLSDAIVGDVGFLKNLRPARGGYVPTHAFMISKPGNYRAGLAKPFVWSHTANRCDSEMDIQIAGYFSSAFRLEDG